MSDYVVSSVERTDFKTLRKIDELLISEGIKRDNNLEHICAVFDSDLNVIATGSAFGNTLRCFAVSSKHQGEGLLNLIISHLLEWEATIGNNHIFLYTKPSSSKYFKDLGFYEITRVEDSLVFMENRKNGFSSYLESISKLKYTKGISGCIVMNANPFTKGHRHLVEIASKACDHLHLFVVSEDRSLVPYNVRLMLVKYGVSDLKNVEIHDSGSYIISNATFPSYFLKDDEDVMRVHAKLDVQLFKAIAQVLSIDKRFVGSEPKSLVTGIYNEVLCEELSKSSIGLDIIQRFEIDGEAVSASDVREAICLNNTEKLKKLLPKTSFDFFVSNDALPIIERIKNSPEIIHH